MANTKHDPRMSQKQISQIMANNSCGNPQFFPVYPTFGGENDCHDTLNADEQIRRFRDFLSNVIARYEGNCREQEEAERQETDLKHAIELADHLTDKEKRLLFRNMRKCLQTRRACKSENELLQPLYDFVRDKELYNRLGNIQGQIMSKKDIIRGRTYVCRTPVLDHFRAPDQQDME